MQQFILTFFPFMDIILKLSKAASVAQSVVHLTRNEKVACSSQVTSSKNPPLTRWDFFIYFLAKLFAALLGLLDSALLPYHQ